jgi:DNA topoisomerase I
MIVESPAKTKTIQKYLGDGWDVAASVGHIRELSKKEGIGYDAKTLRPIYTVAKGKSKVVSNLKRLSAKHKGDVYLATDLDREGESIAWHLAETLKLKKPKRVVFNEITKGAILDAISKPRTIDMNYVDSANARRIIDRMIGFIVSPELIRKTGIKGLSAGRVQSPAVKIINYREEEIRNHTPKEFFTIKLTLENKIEAELDTKPFGKHIFDKAILEPLLGVSSVRLTNIESNNKKIEPLPPLTTSTLVQAACKHFKFGTKQTMDLAQKLFDGGYITYHRTDSPFFSEEGYLAASAYMNQKGLETVPQRHWKTKAGSQDAHEAIRPTDFEQTPSIENPDELKLYDYILERTLLTTLPTAVDRHTQYQFVSTSQVHGAIDTKIVKFISKGVIEDESGWRAFAKIISSKKVHNNLPSIEKGSILAVNENKLATSLTKPPRRFTEASLIASLDKLQIGRPSTYGAIMENIKLRQYISLGDNKKTNDNTLYINPNGVTVVSNLSDMSFMNLNYTRDVEKALDKMAKGSYGYFNLVSTVLKNIEFEVKNKLNGQNAEPHNS